MPWSPEGRVAQCSTTNAGHKAILTALELGEPARIFESTVPALATRARSAHEMSRVSFDPILVAKIGCSDSEQTLGAQILVEMPYPTALV